MFDNPFSMVVAIVLIVTIGSIVRAKYGYRGRKHRRGEADTAIETTENVRLREEVKSLKERIAVLERLATDNNSAIALDREIEKLR